jgi:hypothetical protein
MSQSYGMLFVTLACLTLLGVSCGSPGKSLGQDHGERVVGVRVLAASDGTDIQVNQTAGLQIVDVQCSRGIGRAEFRIPPGARAGEVVFRLHLRGLEGLTVVHNGFRYRASVGSHGDAVVQELREDMEPLEDLDRIPITVIARSGAAPRIPLDGWFDIGLPQSCTGDCSVVLEWVDFYR